MDRAIAELYLKKTAAVAWAGHRVALDIPVDVFSSFQVDRGTQLLLRAIERAGARWARALDLGCGYGPIALHLAVTGAADEVHAIDRDALAVLFTQRNAERNGLGNVVARGGLAYGDLPGAAYDAIVTNLPAKAGEPVHRLMLLGAAEHLAGLEAPTEGPGRPAAAPLTPEGVDSQRAPGGSESRPSGRSPASQGGEVWTVVVRPLEERIDAILAADGVRLLDKLVKKEHVVYRYAFEGCPALPPDPYVRGQAAFSWREHSYALKAFHGLPEFDTLAYATEAVLEHAAGRLAELQPRRVAVWEPGQGHMPVVLARLCPAVERLDLVSRDLVALRASERNLRADGFDAEVRSHHTIDVTVPEGPDLIVGVASEGEGIDVSGAKLAIARRRYPDTPILLGARSSFASRLVRALKKSGVRAKTGRKRRGACTVTIR